jgi:hypothetical protein
MKRGFVREDGMVLWQLIKSGRLAGHAYWLTPEKFAARKAKERAKQLVVHAERRRKYNSDPKFKAEFRKKVAEYRRADYRSDMVARAKRRAEDLGLPFDITRNDLPLATHCPVFGFAFEPGRGKPCDTTPTLDRIVPELGYVKGNVIIVSFKANLIKSSATPDEILKVGKFYKKLQNVRA